MALQPRGAQAQVSLVEDYTNQPRKMRRPQHTFQVRQYPYAIQPIMIAPVVPGETLKQLLLQSRVVTAPIANPIVGWWNEYYFFYLPLTSLTGSIDGSPAGIADTMRDLMIDQSTSPPSGAAATSAALYTAQGTLSVVEQCLIRVVEEFFRDEGETYNAYTVNSMPAAAINNEGVHNSLLTNTAFAALGGTVPTDVEDLDQAYYAWQILVEQKLVRMTYEDFLRSYGIRGREAEDPTKPELLRYVRDWQYPTNTVDPTTGIPASAVSWAHSERADKDRFFAQPGFVFGVTVCRAKVYMSRQVGNASALLDRSLDWLPALMHDADFSTLKEYAIDTGIYYGNTADGYWLDIRDLFVYGDQFCNFSLASTDANMMALPIDALSNLRYPTDAMVQGLFAGTDYLVKQDGIVNLHILGRQVDRT